MKRHICYIPVNYSFHTVLTFRVNTSFVLNRRIKKYSTDWYFLTTNQRLHIPINLMPCCDFLNSALTLPKWKWKRCFLLKCNILTAWWSCIQNAIFIVFVLCFQGEKCERLLDQNFTSVRVSSDEVGNWITVSPSSRQNNMTVEDGGSVFGKDVYATLSWKLMGTDFKDITIFARFQSRKSNGLQTIYNNVCSDQGGSVGIINLLFDPSLEEYSLRFFTEQPVSCKPVNPSVSISHN